MHSIFIDTYPNEVREDIIAHLLKVDSNEWEDILTQAKFITANLHRGPDFGFAIGILCNLNKKTTEFRDLVINTANSLFDWRDDSKIRVRIFASVANLSQSELETISKDEEKRKELVDKMNSDRKVEAIIRI